jgi:hypothetical protein
MYVCNGNYRIRLWYQERGILGRVCEGEYAHTAPHIFFVAINPYFYKDGGKHRLEGSSQQHTVGKFSDSNDERRLDRLNFDTLLRLNACREILRAHGTDLDTKTLKFR